MKSQDTGEAVATVLLAEDAAVIRAALTDVLTAEGYRVLTAGDGEEAVRIAKAERPNAILMDISMPKLDGIGALKRLRRDPATRAISVAATTALALPDDQRRIAAAGFDICLTKPFQIPELLRAVEELLARPAPDTVEA